MANSLVSGLDYLVPTLNFELLAYCIKIALCSLRGTDRMQQEAM